MVKSVSGDCSETTGHTLRKSRMFSAEIQTDPLSTIKFYFQILPQSAKDSIRNRIPNPPNSFHGENVTTQTFHFLDSLSFVEKKSILSKFFKSTFYILFSKDLLPDVFPTIPVDLDTNLNLILFT